MASQSRVGRASSESCLSECGSRHLDAAFVGGIDLQVVPVRGVQAQQAAARGAIARIHHRPEVPPKLLSLHMSCFVTSVSSDNVEHAHSCGGQASIERVICRSTMSIPTPPRLHDVPRVQPCGGSAVPMHMAKETRLRPAGVGEHAAVLEDEQSLHDAGRLLAALLPRRPAQRLQLHLPVDARELPALLQHCLQAACSARQSVIASPKQRFGRALGWPDRTLNHAYHNIQCRLPLRGIHGKT